MVNNSTNINKTNNNITINIDGQQFTNINKTNNNRSPKESQTVMVNNSTNINKTNNNLSPKESLNSEGQQFYQYQQNKQ